jgi:hypothetical protein
MKNIGLLRSLRTMNAYEKAQELGLIGDDAAQVAILRTLTSGDILGTKLGKWLGERNLLSWDGSTWFGTLQDLIDAGAITGDSLTGIRQLKAVLVGPRGDGLATTDPAWAPMVFAIISGIAQVSPDAAEMIDSFYALDGGRPYKDLTVEQFAEQRDDAIAMAAKQAALDLVRNTASEAAAEEYRKSESTPASIVAAAVAVLEGA